MRGTHQCDLDGLKNVISIVVGHLHLRQKQPIKTPGGHRWFKCRADLPFLSSLRNTDLQLSNGVVDNGLRQSARLPLSRIVEMHLEVNKYL